MKKRVLILVLTVLMALGVVTAALAAAQYLPGAATTVSSGQTGVPSSGPNAPGSSSPVGSAPRTSGYSQPAAVRQVAPRSSSAMMPGFLHKYAQTTYAAPQLFQAGEAAWRIPASPTTAGDWDGYGIYAPNVITDSGMLKMWYSGFDIYFVGRIGYAESNDGIVWTPPSDDPVLDVGAPGAWDDKEIGQPFVIKTGSLYQMWYFGANQGGVKQIGYATSSDGLNWTKYAGNPVLLVGDPGDWDETEVGGPRLVFDGTTYHLWYHGYSGTCCDSLGYATSPDGVNWTKYASNPVFGPGAPGEWDDTYIAFTSVLSETGLLHMWYSVGQPGDGIGYATSPDGVAWSRFSGPVLSSGSPGEWDENYIFAPTVIHAGGLYRMWYTGYDINWKSHLGYATSTDGTTWTKSASNPVFAPGEPGLVMLVNYAHDWVVAQSTANTPITISITGKSWITGTTDGVGEFRSWDWTWVPDNNPDILPGDTIRAATAYAETDVDPVGTIDGILDGATDTLAGVIHAPFGAMTLTVRCESWEPPYLSIEVTGVPADGGAYTCDFGALGWDFQVGQKVSAIYYEPDGDSVMNVFELPWMRANYAHDWVGGNYLEGHTFAITVTDSTGGVRATGEIVSSRYGGWGGPGFQTGGDWDPQPPDIQEGDWVYFASDDGYSHAIQIGVISGDVDVDTDSVSGSVYAGWFTQDLNIECHPWGGPPEAPVKSSTAGPNGDPPYFCQWDALTEWDIQPGQDVAAMYIEPDGDRVINVFREPVLNIRSNYGHDWVEGNFEAGHTMWITLTESTGQIKAFATGVTGPIEGWGGQSGFSTNANVPWLGHQPDMQAGDWVYARLDNGLYAESQLGMIDAAADVAADTVNGTIHAPWLTEPLRVDCGIWEPGAPGVGVDGVDPNGGSFSCDFAGSWDVLPGQTIGVSYNEPDGDQVINMAFNPAPNLHIYAQAEGQPAAGSNFSLSIQYRNDGDTPTISGTISAVLEGGMSYVGDTSGLTPSGSGTPGDPLVWHLGALQPDPYHDTRFYLFVQVTAAVGDWITNTLHIDDVGVYVQDNPGDKDAQWSGQVIANTTDLNIGKGAWTRNPVPGFQFVYYLNVCNNGSSDSAEVIVTDTLPLSTTLVSWWGQRPGWIEVSRSAHQLVVSRPSLVGSQCSEVYLRVELDASAWFDMLLQNVAYVSASNDLDPGNNQNELWLNVGLPQNNLVVHKQWNWGELVPGGQIRYNIDYHNDGSLPAEGVRITDTLPANTSFGAAFWYDEVGGHLFTPTLVTDRIVVWDIGTLDNGYGGNFEVMLKIDPQALPGLELINTADITPLADEVRYSDNTSTWTETLNGHGPNLRVRKTGDWRGWGEGHYAWFNIVVENVGDREAEHVTVTDTLPVSMTLEAMITDMSQVENYTSNPAEGWFSVTFRYLHPNWRREIWMSLYNPDPAPVIPGGQFFTNQAEITQLAGEPTYADNTTEYTLASGPDLYVQKSLVDGDIRPGEVVTFSLLFGNGQSGQAGWWSLQGSAWLTDTLPAGTEFITATQRWCGPTYWCPVEPMIQGDTLTWQLWPIGTGDWQEFHVTARLPDNLTGLDTITNRAHIFSDQPDLDIEPDYDNNTAAYAAGVMLPYFEVDKVYASSEVAGMPVLYTLTVSNLGNAAGTTVELWDWIPDWVEYGGGGSYDAGLITWTLPLIGPGGTATAWFSGTLNCTVGGVVNNEDYFVNSSDQGVNSTYGPPVSFTIQMPVMQVTAEASSASVQAGETVYFTGTATTDGTALSYAWDFSGDGTAAGPQASHVFNTPGSYTVTLTVTDGCGYSAEYSLTVEVIATTQNVYLPVVVK